MTSSLLDDMSAKTLFPNQVIFSGTPGDEGHQHISLGTQLNQPLTPRIIALLHISVGCCRGH